MPDDEPKQSPLPWRMDDGYLVDANGILIDKSQDAEITRADYALILRGVNALKEENDEIEK